MNKSKLLKQIISGLVIVSAIFLIYLSAYLPYKKAYLYISAMNESRKAKTLDEFLIPFNRFFNFWSPVGNPEGIRFFAGDVSGILRNESLPKEVAKELAEYSFNLLNSDVKGMKGLNYAQGILYEAEIAYVYGILHKDEGYLKKAEELYKKGLELSPKRPQFLYGLFGLYLNTGRKEEAKKIGEEILKYWPNDEKIKSIIKQ